MSFITSENIKIHSKCLRLRVDNYPTIKINNLTKKIPCCGYFNRSIDIRFVCLRAMEIKGIVICKWYNYFAGKLIFPSRWSLIRWLLVLCMFVFKMSKWINWNREKNYYHKIKQAKVSYMNQSRSMIEWMCSDHKNHRHRIHKSRTPCHLDAMEEPALLNITLKVVVTWRFSVKPFPILPHHHMQITPHKK